MGPAQGGSAAAAAAVGSTLLSVQVFKRLYSLVSLKSSVNAPDSCKQFCPVYFVLNASMVCMPRVQSSLLHMSSSPHLSSNLKSQLAATKIHKKYHANNRLHLTVTSEKLVHKIL